MKSLLTVTSALTPLLFTMIGCAAVIEDDASTITDIDAGDSAAAGGGDTTGTGGDDGLDDGATATGGAATGGIASGGTASGGAATGGAATGGTASGGAATGGAATGGAATGGAATGGTASGGAATGGSATGGTMATGGGGPTQSPGTCLANWRTDLPTATCLDDSIQDDHKKCADLLDCLQMNDCTMSDMCFTDANTGECHPNRSGANASQAQTYAQEVLTGLCN